MHNTQADGLSAREKEIVTLISQGFSSGEIATRLFISTHTVRAHRRNILRRTGAKKMTQVVVLAAMHNTASVTYLLL
jgi:DNA-binding CsgD family transcriptional regulator